VLGHTQGSFLGLKQLRHKVEYSSQSGAKIKIEWSYTSRMCLHGVDSDNFTFYLYLTYSLIYIIIKLSIAKPA